MQKVSLRLGDVDFVRKQYLISDKAECESIFSDASPKYTTRKEILQENNIDIEIQNSWSAEFIPRTLFYLSKLYIAEFKEGEPYTGLTRCITINLVLQGFNMNTAVHSAYSILEQKSYQQLTDLLEIHFLNLSAVQAVDIQKEPIEKQQKLINWLRFIATDDKAGLL